MTQAWRVLLISTVAVFMAFLDVTIVNIAFGSIHRTFSSTPLTELSWVLNAYNVVLAALLVPAGRLADRVGRRRVFFWGLGVFLLGSGLCGVAPWAGWLVAARVVQAAGAAMLIPSSFGLVLAAFPPERRALSTSVWAASGAVAAAFGPSLGGVLVESVGWRSAFFVNFVIALGMVRAGRILREADDAATGGAPDVGGAALLAGGIGALALGIVQAPDWGWTSGRVLGAWLLAGALLIALARRSGRRPDPILEPELLRIPTFRVAIVALLMFSMALFALLLGNIMFLTQAWGYTVLHAGFAVTPGPLMAAVAAGVGGRVAERHPPRSVALAGLCLFAVACLLYRSVGPVPDYAGHWLPAQLVSGAAIGLTFAGLTTASVMDLPSDRLATGTALEACFRQIGAVLGIAMLVAILRAPTMADFRLAWLGMASAAVGAACVAAALPRRRPGEAVAAAEPVQVPGMTRHEAILHGRRIVYRTAGSGPPLLLVHGLLECSRTWRRLAPELARTHTVIAPDLIGHGESDAPPDADYSLGGQAWMLRDLLDGLGHERVTVVGHSLGGGLALAFAGHYPSRVQRLVLIAPGGLGPDVTGWLRVLTVPGTGLLLRAVTAAPVRAVVRRISAVGAEVLGQLADPGGRAAFVRTVRSVMDRRGQIGGGTAVAELVRRIPTLVVWGTADRVIPAAHADGLAGVELELLDGAGHLPHLTRSTVVAARVAAFLGAERQHGVEGVRFTGGLVGTVPDDAREAERHPAGIAA